MDHLYWACFYHTGRIDMYLLYKEYREKYEKSYPIEGKCQRKLVWEELLI